MNRQIAAGLLALTLSGCAHGRAALPPELPALGGPVGLRPSEPTSPVVSRTSTPPAPAETVRTPAVASTPALPESIAPASLVAPPAESIAPAAPPIEASVADASFEERPPVDAAIQQAGHTAEVEPSALAIESPGKPATLIAARVGDTVITQRELINAVKQRVKDNPNWGKMSHEQKEQVAAAALDFLIDRAILIQAAHRELGKKDQKKLDAFREYIMNRWREEELPTLIRREKVADEYELAKALEKRNESLAEKREEYMLNTMAQQFAGLKVQAKLEQPGLPEVYAYYRKNIGIFQQSASVTWREILIPIDSETDQATARQLAEQALSRLQRGEDFADLAREFSKSPNAGKGGLWVETAYDSLRSDVVNAELKRLQPGQLSGILEDRDAFSIIRVESKREAGPKPFDEVQQAIKDALWTEKFGKAMDELIGEYRRVTPITSPFLKAIDK